MTSIAIGVACQTHSSYALLLSSHSDTYNIQFMVPTKYLQFLPSLLCGIFSIFNIICCHVAASDIILYSRL